jgi:hypothetical protein
MALTKVGININYDSYKKEKLQWQKTIKKNLN